jgi:hypothetical protein
MALNMGQLLRLRGMIESAATSVDATGDAAAALTESYARLRHQVGAVMTDSSADLAEFEAAFPRIDVVELDQYEDPRDMAMRGMKYAPQAKRAQVLLGQLAGWVTGLIQELEYEQRSRHDPD